MNGDDLKNNPEMLMQMAKEGDVKAFGCLYEMYFTPIYRYIYFRVKNKEEAENLVQEVFLKACKSIPGPQKTTDHPLAYFFTIARNAIIDHWRKKKEVLAEENFFNKIPANDLGPQEITEKTEIEELIRQAIRQLTEDQQEVIILKFINELSNQEISKLLDKSEEAIRQLQHQALKNLRKFLITNF